MEKIDKKYKCSNCRIEFNTLSIKCPRCGGRLERTMGRVFDLINSLWGIKINMIKKETQGVMLKLIKESLDMEATELNMKFETMDYYKVEVTYKITNLMKLNGK